MIGWIGLAIAGVAIARLMKLAAADLTHAAYVRRVMEGRELAPWEPERPLVTRRGVFDFEAGKYV